MAVHTNIIEKVLVHLESGPLARPFLLTMTLIKDMNHRDLFKQASAMAYVTLLSLIPSLVAIFCVLSLFSPLLAGKDNMEVTIREYILSNLASGTGESVLTYLESMISSLNLATIGWSSFASVLVTLILLLRQIEEALNRIWLITKARNVFTRFMYFWTFMTLGILILGIGIGMLSGFGLKEYWDATAATAKSSIGVSLLMTYLTSFALFFFLYKIVPNCKVQSRNAAIGAASSGLILGVAGWGYGVFVGNAKNYQTIYGALAQLPLFLMWLYICWIIILLGAMLSWRLQEGFPSSGKATGTSDLEVSSTPIEQWRNVQLKNLLPKIVLLSVYKNFQAGSGKGVLAQDLGHQLNLPVDWIVHALSTLESLGFIVASRNQSQDLIALDGDDDAFFPAFPAEKLEFSRLEATLQSPRDEWIANWTPDLPDDIKPIIAGATASRQDPTATIASYLG